jgi:hypothetical protein
VPDRFATASFLSRPSIGSAFPEVVEPEGRPRGPNHLVLAWAVEQAAAGEVADGALGRVEIGEGARSAEDQAKDRSLLAIVFVIGSEGGVFPPHP